MCLVVEVERREECIQPGHPASPLIALAKYGEQATHHN
jgi:hypothetical protein